MIALLAMEAEEVDRGGRGAAGRNEGGGVCDERNTSLVVPPVHLSQSFSNKKLID